MTRKLYPQRAPDNPEQVSSDRNKRKLSLGTLADVKKRAHQLSIRDDMNVGHAYEAVAREMGYRTYAALRAAVRLAVGSLSE